MTDDNKDNAARTIQVVEDNDGVRDLAVQMLTLSGYEVLEAIDAASGLAMFREHPEIDLVFTDVIMPGGISGIEMAKQILSEQSDALILLATGYQEKAKALQERAANSENIVAVSKLYDVNAIPLLVAAMLERNPKLEPDQRPHQASGFQSSSGIIPPDQMPPTKASAR